MGLCAAAATWQTWFWAGLDWAIWPSYVWVVFSGTMVLYAWHRFYSAWLLWHGRAWFLPRRLALMLRGSGLWWGFILCFMGGLLGFNAWLYLHWPEALRLGGLLGLGLALFYVLPWGVGGRRGRDLAWLKGPWLSMAWVWITAALPYLALSEADLNWLWLLERCLWVWLLLLPLDLRDFELDQAFKTKTLVLGLGPKNSLKLGLGLSFCWVLLCFGLYEFKHWPAMLISQMAYVFCLRHSLQAKDTWLKNYGPDVLIILQAGLMGLGGLCFDFS